MPEPALRVLPWAPWQAAGHRPFPAIQRALAVHVQLDLGLLSLDTIDIWGQTVLLVGTVLSMAPAFQGFYPLDASSTSPVMTTKMSPDIARCLLGGKTVPLRPLKWSILEWGGTLEFTWSHHVSSQVLETEARRGKGLASCHICVSVGRCVYVPATVPSPGFHRHIRPSPPLSSNLLTLIMPVTAMHFKCVFLFNTQQHRYCVTIFYLTDEEIQ